jgi:hypothetical protein
MYLRIFDDFWIKNFSFFLNWFMCAGAAAGKGFKWIGDEARLNGRMRICPKPNLAQMFWIVKSRRGKSP